MSRVLITGAAGFIGSHVVDECLRLGMDVVATDDLSGGFLENIPREATWVQGDLRDDGFVASLWHGEPFDVVYHLGAYAAEGLSHFLRRFTYRTNLEGSVNLINQSVLRGVGHFIFASSIAVYGRGQVPMHEDQTPCPTDPYGISKYAVELDLAAARDVFGLKYTIFRPHNVYGERQNISDRYRNVIGIFMSAIMRGQSMPVFGDGSQTRAFSHVADVAPVIAQGPMVHQAVNEVFNVGAGTPCSILELANIVAEEFGVEPDVEHLPPRNEVVHAFCEHEKVRRVFDLPDPIDLRTGIRRMASWARARGIRDGIDMANHIEVPVNLPSIWACRADSPASPTTGAVSKKERAQ